MDKFAVFILTHGRPDNVITYKTLRRCGYTGEIYIIVDNEDSTIEQYRANYGDSVIVFDKRDIENTFDDMGKFAGRGSVIYARNASWDIAKELGLDYFLQLDDDYNEFRYRFRSDFTPTIGVAMLGKLDNLFGLLLEFYKSIPATSIAIGQGGDYAGGTQDLNSIHTRRKAMNTFFCATNRPFQFVGNMNDDVNTYVSLGNQGKLFLTVLQVSINQMSTQQKDGGLTNLYLEFGTYIKSFYTVMVVPSFVTVYQTSTLNKRLHHKINWNNAVPKIISEDYRQAR